VLSARTASRVLSEIATLVELRGESRFKARAYEIASRALHALDVDDLEPMVVSGEIAAVGGVGPATIAVLNDLVANGDSRYLEQLREGTPEGLLEMLRVPGLGTAKIHQIHTGLGVETLHELEASARDGRLAALPRFGPKTAEKILRGIAFLRETGARVLYPHAAIEAARLVRAVRAHPEVVRAEIAGSIRRRAETVADIDVVAACMGSPAAVAAALAHSPGVRNVIGGGAPATTIYFVDGTRLDLHCVSPERFPVALWWATGTADHCAGVVARAAERGLTIGSETVRDAAGAIRAIDDERQLYAAAGMAFVPPELREGRGEIEAATRYALPTLLEEREIRGVLHCHSQYSDGATTITELAEASRARGWRYLGISDHSQSAFYAGGLTREEILRQHEEIDGINASMDGFRVLKGIEADILPCGRVDYDADVLGRFDYVIASIHSRFGMNESQMTERVLKAMDDPHMTILGHPTGRLLLTREPYGIDMGAVIEKAGETGVAIELNADPHRLDLDWRYLHEAKRRGAQVEIGPDAHSVAALDYTSLGVSMARKGWLEASDVLNAREADDVLAFARARRSGRSRSADDCNASGPAEEAVHAG
jgi:DNA polymerase (family X)